MFWPIISLKYLCVCFAFIWSWLCLLKPLLLLLLPPLPSSERFTKVWTKKQRQKMGDMVWFLANISSCQAAGNGIWASFALIIGTIAPWIAFGLWTSGSATLQEPFYTGTWCTRILTFCKGGEQSSRISLENPERVVAERKSFVSFTLSTAFPLRPPSCG